MILDCKTAADKCSKKPLFPMSVPFVLCVQQMRCFTLLLKRIIIIADKAYNAHKNRHKIVIYEICCWTTSCLL